MKLDLGQKKRIFIIGNADNKVTIEHLINHDDFVIRFNRPNPSCTLQADLLFIANGAVVVARRSNLFNNMLKKNCAILWRYTLRDIMSQKYEKTSLSRRLRYFLFLQLFKKKNHFNNRPTFFVPEKIQDYCTELLAPGIPSSGFLAIYMFKQLFPQIPIYIHNFTFEGWHNHNWLGEKELVEEWISSQEIHLATSLIEIEG